ncbi:MAG TPA: endolytic transglycosylase MltG [Spirochaetota bacterium]|nr:endolytic transglycosylase MltG [Spirochaetota bacterium]
MLKKIFIILFTLLIVLLVSAGIAGFILNRPSVTDTPPAAVWVMPARGRQLYTMLEQNYAEHRYYFLDRKAAFRVDPGNVDSAATFTRLLESAGFIRNEKLFNFIAGYIALKKNLCSGFHFISPDMSTLEIINELCSPLRANDYLIITPGDNLQDIDTRLSRKKAGIKAGSFKKNCQSQRVLAKLKQVYKINTLASAEGFMYPGLYDLRRVSSTNLSLLTDSILSNFYLEIGRDFVKTSSLDLYSVLKKASLLVRDLPARKLSQPLCSSGIESILAAAAK